MILLDASGVLAFSLQEPGWEKIAEVIGISSMSVVNMSEALAKAQRYGMNHRALQKSWSDLGLRILDATSKHAEVSADIWPQAKLLGLSLGDRFCAAVGIVEGLDILTSDERLSRLRAGVKITMIR